MDPPLSAVEGLALAIASLRNDSGCEPDDVADAALVHAHLSARGVAMKRVAASHTIRRSEVEALGNALMASRGPQDALPDRVRADAPRVAAAWREMGFGLSLRSTSRTASGQ